MTLKIAIEVVLALATIFFCMLDCVEMESAIEAIYGILLFIFSGSAAMLVIFKDLITITNIFIGTTLFLFALPLIWIGFGELVLSIRHSRQMQKYLVKQIN